MTQIWLLASVLVPMHLVRYFLFAGSAWLYFWKWTANPFTAARRLQHVPFQREDLRREIRFSVLTAVIFGVFFALAYAGRPPVPLKSSGAPAVLEFVGWLVALLVIHDTYFYWSHRLAHHPRLFPYLHSLHHQSRNPSPFAALAFQPTEALLQVVWAVPVSRLLPVPSAVWLVFAFVAMAINVLGHCGVELYPLGWQRHRVWRWLNFATMHNEHHLHVGCNYGLYFSFWDRVVGTLREAPAPKPALETQPTLE